MNIPTWLAERFAGDAVEERPDGEAPGLGAVAEVVPVDSGLHLAADVAALTVRFLADDILEVSAVAPGEVELQSFARLQSPLCAAPSECLTSELEGGWSLRTRTHDLDVRLAPLGVSLRQRDGEAVFADDSLGLVRTARGWRAHWQLDAGDRVYGLGAKTGSLDRRGRRTVLWARDALVGERSDPLYSAIPFFLIARGGRWLGVLLDSAARSVFDFGHTTPQCLSFGPQQGPITYIVFAGPKLRDVLRQYTALTGRAPLPPRWSLGHHQSRYSYNDEEEVREVATEFRRRGIPTDVIHLDIHYMRGFRVFTFHPKRFPHPARLSADLARDGFRLVTIVDPGVKKDKRYPVFQEGVARGYFARGARGDLHLAKVWPGAAAFPDFYRSEVRRWWGDWHHVYTDAGIAGIWNDMNEPAGWNRAWYVGEGVIPFGQSDFDPVTHGLDDGRRVPHALVRNAYGHSHSRAAYEGLLHLRPEERAFVLTRSAFAGTQRFAAQWTGDVMSTWSALRQSLPMLMGLGLSGVVFAGSDIGGFVSDTEPELFARWMQIGALAPFCRTHTSLHTHRQEPWSFGPRIEGIVRAALRLRYQLLPYLYTCFREASLGGMPLWRPLFAEFEGDERLHAIEDQVMIGPALMAAPVLEPGATSRRVVLPPGTWFDWYGGQVIDGGGVIEAEAPLERMPLYVRADVAIPTQPEVRFADDRPEQPLIWEVFLTPSARGDIGWVYEDDGHSFAYQQGELRVTRVVAEETALRFASVEGWYASPRSSAIVRLHATGVRAAAGEHVEVPHGAGEQVVSLTRA